MRDDEQEASKQAPCLRVDISACLDAVNMYDAAYHRDRDNPTSVPQPLEIVSLWEYLWAQGKKSSVVLFGQGLSLTLLLAGGVIVANAARNVYEYQLAQPSVLKLLPPEPHRTIPSPYPLPPDWIETNLTLYALLVGLMFLSRWGSVVCQRRAHSIKTGVPINYADTAHLPAQESLVRASQEPARESLVRASQASVQNNLVRAASLPSTPPSILLRSATGGRETPQEQLVRPTGGQEQA